MSNMTDQVIIPKKTAKVPYQRKWPGYHAKKGRKPEYHTRKRERDKEEEGRSA